MRPENKRVLGRVGAFAKADPGAADSSTGRTRDIEVGATNIMGKQGWNQARFKAGAHIKVVAHSIKDRTKGASLCCVILPHGKRLYHDIARPKGEGSPNP